MTPKKNSKFLQKSFFFFGFISLLFWFLTKLSKNYETTIEFPVDFVGLSEKKVINSDIPKMIPVHVKGTGFRLAYVQVFPSSIEVDCSSMNASLNDEFLLDLEAQKNTIQKQLPSGIQVDYFLEDMLLFQLDDLEERKIRIKPQVTINFKEGYDVYQINSLKPDSIKVSGPKRVLDTLNLIRTTKLVLNEVESDINEILKIDTYYKSVGLSFKDTEIVYQINVDKFTEGTIEVPFEVENVPEGEEINTFPKAVKITYKVGLKDYNEVNASLFKVVCDYAVARNNNLNFLIPKLISKPTFIKKATINTQKIDFYIKKW